MKGLINPLFISVTCFKILQQFGHRWGKTTKIGETDNHPILVFCIYYLQYNRFLYPDGDFPVYRLTQIGH